MGLLDDVQFNLFHFMPYPVLPPDHKDYPSVWVDFPNRFFDPKTAHELYERYWGELVLADELGFDGIAVNEHHSTSYSLNPAPNLTAAAIIPRTSHSRICVYGTPPNLELPNRLAEEYAMLDVMSGGRLEVAFPLGTGMEYWSNPVNPVTARARFRESLDIILQAWTAEGPTEFDGEFFHYRYLNPWPKPMQQPYPRAYIVGAGSPETLELAAEYGFGYSVVFIPNEAQNKVFQLYRERTTAYGHEFRTDDLMFVAFVYVAETDQQAEDEFKEHVQFFFENGLRTTPRFLNPPGYVTVPEFKKRLQAANVHGAANWDDLVAYNRIAFGSPETVAEKLAGWLEDAGCSKVNLCLQLGDMPAWKTDKNIRMFAEHVMPKFKTAAATTGSTR